MEEKDLVLLYFSIGIAGLSCFTIWIGMWLARFEQQQKSSKSHSQTPKPEQQPMQQEDVKEERQVKIENKEVTEVQQKGGKLNVVIDLRKQSLNIAMDTGS